MAGLDIVAAISLGMVPVLEMLFLATRKPWARKEPGTDVMILEYGRGLKAFAFFAAASFSFLSIIYTSTFFTAPDRGGLSPALLALILIPFLLLGAVFGLEIFRVQCRFTRSQIARHSPWTDDLTLTWEEIDSITYDPFAEWYVIRSRRGKIRLHRYLNGLADFISLAKERVPEEKWRNRGRRAALR